MSNPAFTIPKPINTPNATPTAATGMPNTTPVAEPKAVKETKERTRSTTTIDAKHIAYVLENVTKDNMGFKAMADALNISEHQVKQIVNHIKDEVRKDVKAKATAKNETPYGTRPVKERGKDTTRMLDDYEKPLTEEAKKAENYIKTYLSRPDSVRKGNPETKQAMKSAVDSVLAKIGL